MTVANPDAGTTQPIVNSAVADSAQPAVLDQPKTILDGGGDIVTPQDWPEDWRNRMAGDPSEYENEDDFNKELKRLEERFKSPKDIFKSYREMEKFAKSRKPEPQKPGPDASPEEMERYRAERGLPNSPQDYDLSFEDGFTVGDDVKPDVDAILDLAHKNHLDAGTTKTLVRAFAENEIGKQQMARQADEQLRVTTLQSLKQEWGGEFEGNINAIAPVFSNAPKELMARLLTAKDPETGLSVGNDPDTVRWLVDLGKSINPTATLVPSGKNDAAGIQDEIKKIESMIWSEDKAERQRYRTDDAIQERYRALLTAKQKMQG